MKRIRTPHLPASCARRPGLAAARALLWLAASLLPAALLAQPRLTVADELVNVGEILYRQPRTVSFEIRNSGTEPLVLTRVNASCGCTRVEWPSSPIPAGGSAVVAATYDARTMGSFQKELELYTNASDQPTYLTLQGRVVESASDYEGSFPVDLGSVRLSTNVVEFDDVNTGDHPEVVLQVLNNSRGSYKPELMHLPPYLTARYQPERLAGGRVGRIFLRLNSEKLTDYGLTQTTIYLARHLGDKVGPANEIAVSALRLPAFAHLSAGEMAEAPCLQLSEDSVDFGAMGGKKKLSRTILVSNTGRRPLTVSTVQVYGKALSVSLSTRTILPGRQAKLRVTVAAQYLPTQKHTPRVLLIADDPSRPKTVIPVRVQP